MLLLVEERFSVVLASLAVDLLGRMEEEGGGGGAGMETWLLLPR